MIEPTLITMYGENTGVPRHLHKIVRAWPYMSRSARQCAIKRYPELMGVWPIIAKIAAVAGKGVAGIMKAVKGKKAKVAKAKAAKREEQKAIIEASKQEEQAKKDKMKMVLMIGVPVVVLGGFLLLRKK